VMSAFSFWFELVCTTHKIFEIALATGLLEAVSLFIPLFSLNLSKLCNLYCRVYHVRISRTCSGAHVLLKVCFNLCRELAPIQAGNLGIRQRSEEDPREIGKGHPPESGLG